MQKLLFTLLLILLTPLSSHAQDQAMLVFDASGSMWGQINGQPKIDVAKEALNKVISDWNDDIHLGLIAYGHRRKGDCNDIQTLVPIGQLNKNSMISKVKAIKPKGKTPISLSIKKAAEGLRYTEEKATVILISDGKETCDADPCATAKVLKSEGIDFITHVIGFDVDKQTGQQLKCIADTTGGEYFSAKNAASLNDAMGKIAEKIQKEEAKPPAAKKLKNNIEVTASETEGGKWVDASNYIYLQNEEGKADSRAGDAHSTKKKTGIEKLPIGKYVLVSSYNEFKKEILFEIKAGETTKLNIVFGQTGKVEVSNSETKDGKWIDASNYIYIPNDEGKAGDRIGDAHATKKKIGVDKLPIGKYVLVSSYNEFKKEILFEIKAGETTKLNIVFGQTGKVEVSNSETEGGKWIDASNYIYIPNEEGKAGDRIGDAHATKKKIGVDKLPIGKYVLVSSYNEFKKEILFEIKAGETTKLNIVFGQTGKVEIASSEKEGGKWVDASNYIYIPNEEGKAGDRIGDAHSSKKKAGIDKLPVGKYIVISSYKAFKKETLFEIKAGKVTKLNIVFSQFIIKTKCADMQATINHEVYASSGKLVFDKKTSCSKPANAVLESGSYTLTSIIDNQSKDTKFSIGADHPNQITIDMQQSKTEPSHQELIDADTQKQSLTARKEEKPISNQEAKSEQEQLPSEQKQKKDTSEQDKQVHQSTPADNAISNGFSDIAKQMEAMSKQNQSFSNKQLIDENGNVNLPSTEEVQGAMRQAGALINGLRHLGKDLEKGPLKGLRESMQASLPKYEASVTCYEKADDLSEVKQCEAIEKELVELAQEKFQIVTGFKSDKDIKLEQHTEWNDVIKQKTVARKQADLKEIKLILVCFDQGAGFLDLQDCIKNDGKHTPKKSEFEALGNLLNAFGGATK